MLTAPKAFLNFLVNELTTGTQRLPEIGALSNGGFVITWRSAEPQQGDESGQGIKARIFNADGTEIASEFLVNELTQNHQWNPSITVLNDDRFVVSWTSDETSSGNDGRNQAKARIFNADGTEDVSEFYINTPSDYGQRPPSLTTLSDGRFIATWSSYEPFEYEHNSFYIKAKIFNADGSEAVPEFIASDISQSDQYNPSVTSLDNGGFIISWEAYPVHNGDLDTISKFDIKARIFNADGVPVPQSLLEEDERSIIDAGILLENDSDADGDTLTITEVSETSAAGASVSLDEDGNIEFNPNDVFDYLAEGETTTDTFTYTISDGNGGTDTATVTYRITGVNDAPVLAHPISDHSFNEGQQIYVGLPYDMFEDVDNTTGLDFSISQADGSELPEWLTFYTGDGEFRGVAPEGSAGTYSIRVSASDRFATASDVFEITISDEVTPPTVEPTRVLFEDDFADGVRAFTEGNNGNSASVVDGELALVGGAWTQAGFSLNSVQSVDADNNILELQIYRDAGSNGVLSLRDASWRQFVLNENNNQFWSIDGESGFSGLNDLEEGQWHTLRIDMDAIGMSSFRIFGIMGNANGNDSFQIDDVAIFDEDYGIEGAIDGAGAELLSADEDDAFVVTKSSAPTDAQPAWTEYDENSYASNEESSDQPPETTPTMEVISDVDDAFYSSTVQDDFLI